MVNELALRRQHDEERAAQAAREKTFSDEFPQAAAGVRTICEVATDATLPPFYGAFARLTRRDEHVALLRSCVLERSNQADSMRVMPVITPELMTIVRSFEYGSYDVDDLAAGLSPFLVHTVADGDTAQQHQRVLQFNLVQTGHLAPTLDQLGQLAPFAPRMPANTVELRNIYRALSVLLDVLLGTQHRVCVALRGFAERWDREAEPDLLSLLGAENNALIRATLPLCLRHTQLRLMRYFAEALRAGGGARAPTPDFEHLITQIKYERTISGLPSLPSRYLLKPPPVVPVPRTPPAGGGAGGPGATTPRPGGGTGPPGSGGAGGAGGAAALGTTVGTAQLDGDLVAALGASQKTVRQLVGRSPEATWPKDEPGTTALCLSYALTGRCFTACRRCATHRNLTAREKQQVLTWIAARASSPA
jgi:hypothetical protein